MSESKTNGHRLLSCLTDFVDRPAGTSALYAREMSSGGEKQHPLVLRPPQVLDEHLVTPLGPSGRFCQLFFFFSLFLAPALLSHLNCVFSSPIPPSLVHAPGTKLKISISLHFSEKIN